MKCEYLDNKICTIATQLAGSNIFPIVVQCNYCTKHANPNRSINKVTVSIAIGGSSNLATKIQILKDYGHLLAETPTIEEGPGTELKKLLSWFYSPTKKCNCSTRIQKMNKWGPNECEKRIETIMRWMKHSARINNVPYFELAVKLVIRKAIKNARCNCSSNNCT